MADISIPVHPNVVGNKSIGVFHFVIEYFMDGGKTDLMQTTCTCNTISFGAQQFHPREPNMADALSRRTSHRKDSNT
jgi:hypothetical protein